MRIEHMRFVDTGTCRKCTARKNSVQKEQTPPAPSQVNARGSGLESGVANLVDLTLNIVQSNEML